MALPSAVADDKPTEREQILVAELQKQADEREACPAFAAHVSSSLLVLHLARGDPGFEAASAWRPFGPGALQALVGQKPKSRPWLLSSQRMFSSSLCGLGRHVQPSQNNGLIEGRFF